MKTKRRGFTIVELVIVIAVIGILTAILVPTFTSLIGKANLTADTSTAKTLNTYLAAEEVDAGKPATMDEVVELMDEHGYRLEKLKLSDNASDLLWDETNNRFVIVKNGSVIYSEGNVSANYKLWQIIDSAEKIAAVADQKYSMYIASNVQVATINAKVGVNVGSNQNVKTINYVSNGTAVQNVNICTNGGLLTIDAENDTVNHYGVADKVLIEAVAGNSYHENGIVPNIEIKQGRVEIAATAEVSTVVVTGNSVAVQSADENVEVKIEATVTTQPTISGTTKTETVNKITTLSALRDAIAEDDFSVVLGADIIGSLTIQNSGKLDLNGYKIQNTGDVIIVTGDVDVEICGSGLIKSTGDCGISAVHGAKVTISEVTVEVQEVAVFAQYAAEVVINSGTFTTVDNFVIGSNGSNGRGNNKFTINGGTFNGNIASSGYIACGIYVANDDTVVVNGGTFNITNGVVVLMRAGKTTINEGVVCNVTSTGTISSGRIGDSRINIETTTYFVVDYRSNYPGMNENFYCHNNTEYALTEINAAN